MPSLRRASPYWRGETAKLRFLASERTCLNESLGAVRSQPSMRRTVSSAVIVDCD